LLEPAQLINLKFIYSCLPYLGASISTAGLVEDPGNNLYVRQQLPAVKFDYYFEQVMYIIWLCSVEVSPTPTCILAKTCLLNKQVLLCIFSGYAYMIPAHSECCAYMYRNGCSIDLDSF
jgi:hypothetical protein